MTQRIASFCVGLLIFGGLFVFCSICLVFGFGNLESSSVIWVVSFIVTAIMIGSGMEKDDTEEEED